MRTGTIVCLFLIACGSAQDQGTDSGTTAPDGATPPADAASGPDASPPPTDGSTPEEDAAPPPATKVVFVIPMENQDYTKVIGDSTDAPYINGTLVPTYATASSFQDELALAVPSEPHYVWMESGTNAFKDHTFLTDNDSSSTNSTSSTAHLTTELEAANVSWTSYQEGIAASTCPIKSTGFFAAKHDPFVFFQDVAGSPPSASNAHCIAHHKPLTSLAGDLQGSAVAAFNFVTPNLCHDMHGASGCTQQNNVNANIKAGDDWLKANLQPMIDYAFAHDGYVFIVWDEGDSTNLIPFVAIGKHAIAGHVGTVKYTHSSLLKSEEEILGVPVLSSVSSATDFADLFEQGTFP